MSDERREFAEEPFPKGLTAQEWMDWCPWALAEIKRLNAEVASLTKHDASSVSNWEFALIERDKAQAELSTLKETQRVAAHYLMNWLQDYDGELGEFGGVQVEEVLSILEGHS